MREVRRRYTLHPRGILRRAADGRLRPAVQEPDIADIWAAQDRIRLADAIRADAKKMGRKHGRRGLLTYFKKHAKVTTEAHQEGGAKEISLTLSLPRLHRPMLPKISKKAKVMLGAVVLVVGASSVLGSVFRSSGRTAAPHAKDGAPQTAVQGASLQSPDYDTLLPTGKTIQDLGGWTRVSPPTSNPVFAYADSIAGVHITVSEQPLPDTFKDDPTSSVTQLAKQFNASDKLAVLDGMAYIGTSQGGNQSLVITKRRVLILIRSAALIPDNKWIGYVDSLE